MSAPVYEGVFFLIQLPALLNITLQIPTIRPLHTLKRNSLPRKQRIIHTNRLPQTRNTLRRNRINRPNIRIRNTRNKRPGSLPQRNSPRTIPLKLLNHHRRQRRTSLTHIPNTHNHHSSTNSKNQNNNNQHTRQPHPARILTIRQHSHHSPRPENI